MQQLASRLQPRSEARSFMSSSIREAPGPRQSLREGIYQFNYWIGGNADHSRGRGLAVLRAGSVLGSDEWGGVFTGTYRLLETDARHHVSVTLRLPPFGELVTGHRAGAQGMEFKIDCTFETPEPQSLAIVHVEGVPVAVELVYIGAVPTS